MSLCIKHLYRPLAIFLLLSNALALSGCCDCFDEGLTNIDFEFSADSLNGSGFRRTQVKGAYLVRFAAAQAAQVLDTLRQPRLTSSPDSEYFYVNYYLGSSADLTFFLDGRSTTRSGQTVRSFDVVVPSVPAVYHVTNLDVTTGVSKSVTGCNCGYIKDI